MSYPGGQTLEQVRQVDPIWTGHVQGYVHAERVGGVLFPAAPVTSRKGKVLRFGRDSFRLSSSKRAPGTSLRRRRFTHDSVPYELDDHAEQLIIPIEEVEEGASVPGTQVTQDHMDQFMEVQTLEHEKQCADLALDSAQYAAGHAVTIAAGDRWDQAAANPVDQTRQYKNVVANAIGRMPNTLLLGQDAFDAACENDRVRDQIKYTSPESINEAVLARVFGVERVVVGRAIYDDASGAKQKVWTATSGVLAYVDPGMAPAVPPRPASQGQGHGAPGVTTLGGQRQYSRRRPSYGYTYQLEGYPVIRGEYWDEDIESWKYPFVWPHGVFLTFQENDLQVAGVLLEGIV